MLVSRPDIKSDLITKYTPAERFIKLDLPVYMNLLGQTPIPPQIALINAVNNPAYRYIVAVLSRRTGKTHISNIIGQLVTLIPGSQVLIIAPNYSLSTISWDLQRNLLNTFDIELRRCNAKDRIIELENGSIIRIGSVTQADSVVGRSYDLIIFDEAALNNKGAEVFNIQLMPTLDKQNSKAIFISTPRGKNWFHDFYLRGFTDKYPDWCSILSTYSDNPRADLRAIESAKRTLSHAEFGQEYECDFVALQGQIWNLPPENIIDVDLSTIDVVDVIAGLDIGFRDATAFCIMVTDGKNIYIIDEYQSSGKTTDTHGRAISEMIKKHGIDFIYIDSAAQQTRFDLVMNWDISTINATKSILDGIGYVAGHAENGRIFVDRKCTHSISTFSNYQWDNREGLITEKPVHNEFCHMADAIRYAVYSHAYNLQGN